VTDEPIERAPDESGPERTHGQASDQAPDQADVIESGSGANANEEDERIRGATPPGYDWPTHGGYLGCLLGVIIACLLAPLAKVLFYLFYGFEGVLLPRSLGGFGVALAVIVTVGVYLAIFVALTRLGWYMGKRFLREYEQPARPVWGEDDDDEAYPLVVEADQPKTTPDTADTSDASAPKQSESAG
jgi:hypothetical protein